MIPKAPYCSEPCGDAAGKRLVVVWRSAEPTRSPGQFRSSQWLLGPGPAGTACLGLRNRRT